MKDPYLYENSNVLINKANILEQDKLDEFENRMTNLALVSLFRNEIMIQDVFDLFKIHKYLFERVYEWAGKKRTINITKSEPIINGRSVGYADYKFIDNDLVDINKKYFNYNWDDLNKEAFVLIFTEMIAAIWKNHPFREGNTRTVSAFAFLFLKQKGYQYNAALIQKHAKYFRNALVMASIGENSEYQYLQKILEDAITNKEKPMNSIKYSKIKNYDVDTYQYEYHKVK